MVQYTYDAWGKPTGKTGTLANTLGVLNPFRYRGYVYDEETGLYYLKSRYYDPVWGRFVSADTVVANTTFQSSAYVYCKNSPLCYDDTNGYFLKKLWKGITSQKDALVDTANGAVVDATIACALEPTNVVKGEVVGAVFDILGSIAFIGVRAGIIALGVSAGMASLGTAIIAGPLVLGLAIAGNFIKQDIINDGKLNSNLSRTQTKQAGMDALSDYGLAMIETVADGNKIVETFMTAHETIESVEELASKKVETPVIVRSKPHANKWTLLIK